MGLVVELVPLTEISAEKLGPVVSELCSANTDRLRVDFPSLGKLYSSPQRAVETIRDRQAQMRTEGGFTVCAVMLGWAADGPGEEALPKRMVGMTSHNPKDIPPAEGEDPTGRPGLHLAAWLDRRRPDPLRKAGVAIMGELIRHMVSNPDAGGYPWTLILPSNQASRAIWDHEGYPGGGFATDGVDRIYPSMDKRNRRVLYVARFTLEQLRTK